MSTSDRMVPSTRPSRARWGRTCSRCQRSERSWTSASTRVASSIARVIQGSRSGALIGSARSEIGLPTSPGVSRRKVGRAPGEAPDATLPVEHQDGELDCVEEVQDVGVDELQVLVAAVELVVHRGELLVGRLELLLGRLQLLVEALELLVAGDQLVVGGGERVGAAPVLLEQDGQVLLGRRELFLERPVRGRAGAGRAGPGSPRAGARRRAGASSKSTTNAGSPAAAAFTGSTTRSQVRPPPVPADARCRSLCTGAAVRRASASASRSGPARPARAILRSWLWGSPAGGSR